ncbi:MAG: hypothetical protein ACP5RD_08380, partial [bacterium]
TENTIKINVNYFIVSDKKFEIIKGIALKIDNGILVKLNNSGQIKFIKENNNLLIDISKSGFDVIVKTITILPKEEN